MPKIKNKLSESNPGYSDGLDSLIEKRKNKERIVVWATGISGSGRLDYIALQQQLALTNKNHFEILDVSDFFWKAFSDRNQKLNKENILNFRETELHDKLGTAYKEISDIIHNNPQMDFVVTGHACFCWDGTLILGYDPSCFNDLKPDLFVNIIDNEMDIADNLRTGEHKKQWEKQKLDEVKIIPWMDNEFVHTKLWADFFRKPWAMITRRMSPTTLYMMMYHPERPWTYYVQQMTHALTDKSYDQANELFMELITRTACFNPKGFESFLFEQSNPTSAKYTRKRDMYFVAQAEELVAFYKDHDDYNKNVSELIESLVKLVKKNSMGQAESLADKLRSIAVRKGPTPSEGAAHETSEGFCTGKSVDRIWPLNPDTGNRYCSPFVIANSTGLFDNPKSLIESLDRQYGEAVKMTIPKHIIDDAMAVHLVRRKQIPENYHD